MVILRTRNKITDFFMILAWASPFNVMDSLTLVELSSNKYIRTHQSVIVRLNCSNLAGAILLQLLFGLHITVLFNIDGH